MFLAKKREISQSDILIKQMSRNFELRIQELEQKLTALIEHKTETLTINLKQTATEVEEVKDEHQTFKVSSTD